MNNMQRKRRNEAVPAGTSVPCGLTATGLPIGLQLVARPWWEDRLLAVAHRYEQATSWHHWMPTTIA